MNKNCIDWDSYCRIKRTYSHVGSFAYWPDNHKGNEAKPLIVNDEEEFNEKLLNRLHADVVIVGLNFGITEDIKKIYENNFTEIELVDAWKKVNFMNNQYGGKYGKKALNEPFKNSIVEGAYMTDFFKFNLKEENWSATGMPSSDGNKLTITPELIEFNAEGLKYELSEVVGVKQDPIFIFLGSHLNSNEKIKDEVKKHYPTSLIYSFSHYQRRVEKGESLKELFKLEGAEVLKQINKNLLDR